jgi:hypothetical protein
MTSVVWLCSVRGGCKELRAWNMQALGEVSEFFPCRDCASRVPSGRAFMLSKVNHEFVGFGWRRVVFSTK